MTTPGRILLHTGDGKGKTTAALGTAFRALGHGKRVCVIQFLKGTGEYGERVMARSLDNLDWHICGKGFVFNKEDIAADRQVAREGFALARRLIAGGDYDLVVLDEITYLPHYDFLDVAEIVEAIRSRPPHVTIIMTGRSAVPELIELADTVSEVRAVKHAFDSGIKAQKGVEF